MRDVSVTGLAAENLAKAADFSIDVVSASLPLLSADMAAIIGRYETVQIVGGGDGGLFLIGWRGKESHAYSLARTNQPLKL